MSLAEDVLAEVGTVAAAVSGIQAANDFPVWLDPQNSAFPQAFYYSLPDRSHRIIGQDDVEIEGSIRIEMIFHNQQIASIRATTYAMQADLIAAIPTFNGTHDVDVIGIPISAAPGVFDIDGVPYGYSAVDFLWNSGVVS